VSNVSDNLEGLDVGSKWEGDIKIYVKYIRSKGRVEGSDQSRSVLY
jgi:hypothetical protein